jgi:GNAT superfamily N-acetyltransferase
MIEVKEVKTSRDLKKFINFQFTLYKDCKYWIPPLILDEKNTLRKDKNPAFEYCDAKYWLAYKEGRIVGRIAGIISHKYIEKWGSKNARFGWVDFIDDEEVSKALFDTVENWAKEKGMEGVHGPLGFCDLDKEGMLIEGFEEMGMFITIYNYPYYMKHMEKLGYIKDTDWLEFEIKAPGAIPEKVERINDAVMKRLDLRIFAAKKPKELLPYAHEIFQIINEAYSGLYGVVPLSEKQIASYTKQYFSFINTDYVRLILNTNNEVVAFGICAPSLAKSMKKAGGRILPFGFIHILRSLKRNDALDLYLVAVKPELQAKGINALLMTEVTKMCIRNSIVRAETGPELESNDKIQALWKHYETRQHKKRRCYIKKVV